MTTHAELVAAEVNCSKFGGPDLCPLCSSAVTFYKPRKSVVVKMKRAFLSGIKITPEDRWKPLSPVVNGYKPETLRSYLCPQCHDLVMWKIEDWIPKNNNNHQWHARLGTDTWKQFVYSVTEEDSQFLKSLPYSDFLKTDYWNRIRDHVLAARYHKCFLCPATGFTTSLNVHHRSYEHHGYEHLHTSDLVVLCRPCHQRHHGFLAKEAVA